MREARRSWKARAHFLGPAVGLFAYALPVRTSARRWISVAFLGLVAGSVPACAPRERMCAVDDPCKEGLSCVSGRCVSPKAAVRLFEVDDAGAPLVKRRVLVPTDLAWLSGDAVPPGAVPDVAGFGGASRGVLLLRFGDVVVPPDLVEAYVILRRAPGTDPPVAPVVLGAHRIEEPWDSKSLSPSRPPRLADVLGPETRVLPVGGEVVRIDVRALVAGWASKRVNDHGVAIAVAGDTTTAPLYVALAPTRGVAEGPVLEMYAR